MLSEGAASRRTNRLYHYTYVNLFLGQIFLFTVSHTYKHHRKNAGCKQHHEGSIHAYLRHVSQKRIGKDSCTEEVTEKAC